MKCLHLFSDWKWTGPAEPVVSLCENLAAEGIDVSLAFRKAPEDFKERTVGKEAHKQGVRGYEALRLNRYFSIRDWAFDVRAIGRYAADHKVDIVHAHLTHDHVLAALGLTGKKKCLLVRTDHKRDGLGAGYAMKTLLSRTDGLVSYARTIQQHDILAFDFPEERTAVLSPGVRVPPATRQDLRTELGIAADEKVIGVIGRLKPDRGYDVILRAFKMLRERTRGVKLVIVGRSSQIEESIRKPVSALGLQDDVILAGYRLNDYFPMIATFDLFVMIRAGSDGTARALREVMAMGKPAIVSDRGMLPELVHDGTNGYVIADDRQLAERMEQVLTDDALRTALGDAARRCAVEEWDYRSQARRMVEFYEKLLRMGKR